MKLNANCGSIELLGNHMKKEKRVNDEIIMKCLVTMILELLLQMFGMVHTWSPTQIQKDFLKMHRLVVETCLFG